MDTEILRMPITSVKTADTLGMPVFMHEASSKRALGRGLSGVGVKRHS